MSLRFAILKTVGEKDKVVLEYDGAQILTRLKARVRENLAARETKLKIKHTKDEVGKAIEMAYNGLVLEFKEKTVKLT